MTIFNQSTQTRKTTAHHYSMNKTHRIPKTQQRKTRLLLPELSELEVVRHFTRLSRKNFSIDTHFYPLGSCTMKYNPRAAHKYATLPGFSNLHPLSDIHDSQGAMQCFYELQTYLTELTGMTAVSLTPMAGAQGEFVGVAMIAAYHRDHHDFNRTEMIVPDAAHGTNPASAMQCGFTVKEVPTKVDGDLDIETLKQMVGPKTAGIMLTNPSTLGVFERNIKEIAKIVHEAGGLLYYDGANLNAILGSVRPGDMGFDVMHLNLHKTFATPHGGGGPGAGPVACNKKLAPYLPIPMVALQNQEYVWLSKKERPQSIGRLSAFHGNAGVLLRAFIYCRLLGRKGLKRVGEYSTLNANYLMNKLREVGYTIALNDRLASHEFIITIKPLTQAYGVKALDVAKRLLDYGIHAPTVYFPLLIPECLLIEPTETESLQQLDQFVEVMTIILNEIKTDAALVKNAPHTMPVRRLDEVSAAKNLDLTWTPIDEKSADL